jgi:hypothetical protein
MAEKLIVPSLRGTAIGRGLILSNIYVGVGRTTAWEDENDPPTPSSNIEEIEELLIYKKPDKIAFIVPDEDEGTITVLGNKYRELTLEEARTLQSRLMLISVTFSTSDFGGIANYRQLGVFAYVIPTTGNEAKTVLLPEEIDDPGYPIHFANRSPYYCYANHGETINLIVAY